MESGQLRAAFEEGIPRGVCAVVGLHGVPFDFAQGRLSTAVVLRYRETQSSLRMTNVKADLLMRSAILAQDDKC